MILIPKIKNSWFILALVCVCYVLSSVHLYSAWWDHPPSPSESLRLSEFQLQQRQQYLHLQEDQQQQQQQQQQQHFRLGNSNLSLLQQHNTNSNKTAAISTKIKKRKQQQQPWFVLHIGPPKTATTTLQCGLEQHSRYLAQYDDWYYLGGGCGTPREEYLMPNDERTVLQRPLIEALNNMRGGVTDHDGLDHTNHFRALIRRLRTLRERNQSAVISGELIGAHVWPIKKNLQWLHDDQLQKRAGFAPHQVRIVLAYRHFVDWMPSFYYQKHFNDLVLFQNINNGEPAQTFREYVVDYLNKWDHHQQLQQQRRRRLAEKQPPPQESPFVTYFEKKQQQQQDEGEVESPFVTYDINGQNPELLPYRQFNTHPSWWSYRFWSQVFPDVQVYDMHTNTKNRSNKNNDDDMVTNFVCQMLPTATRTCNHLRQGKNDKNQKDGDSVGGVLDGDALHDDATVSMTNATNYSIHSFLHPDHKSTTTNNNATAVRATADDHHAARMAQEALKRGWIRRGTASDTIDLTKSYYTNRQITKAVHELLLAHEIVPSLSGSPAGDSSSSTNSSRELFFDCLSPQLEQRLWNASRTFLDLMYLRTPIMPLSRSSSSFSNYLRDEPKEQRWKQAIVVHDRLFERNKVKGKYCDINPLKVMDNHPAVAARIRTMVVRPSLLENQWMKLGPAAQQAARVLGFDGRSWNSDSPVPVFRRPWQDLSEQTKMAAIKLGWDEAEWALSAAKYP